MSGKKHFDLEYTIPFVIQIFVTMATKIWLHNQYPYFQKKSE